MILGLKTPTFYLLTIYSCITKKYTRQRKFKLIEFFLSLTNNEEYIQTFPRIKTWIFHTAISQCSINCEIIILRNINSCQRKCFRFIQSPFDNKYVQQHFTGRVLQTKSVTLVLTSNSSLNLFNSCLDNVYFAEMTICD